MAGNDWKSWRYLAACTFYKQSKAQILSKVMDEEDQTAQTIEKWF